MGFLDVTGITSGYCPRNDMISPMKRPSILFLLFLLFTSCAPAATPNSSPTNTATLITITPTFTSIPLSATVTSLVPTQTSTSTPEVCDPSVVEYCITQGHFLFQRPIKLPANASVDVTYRYASTANGTRDPHHGVEFLNKFGTPVYAAGDGVVVFAGPDQKAVYSPWPDYYGNVVVIKHAD